MVDLSFQIEKAEPLPFAAAPTLVFKLFVAQTRTSAPIHTAILRCQIRIEPAKRRYAMHEQERLTDLFDAPERWGRTMQPMLWTHASVVLPAFADQIEVDLPVPCSFDFNVAATKYFYALEEGEAPLTFLFSGTVFYEGPDAGLQVAQIPWEKEVVFRLPAKVWKDLIEQYYPNTAWLCLRRDVFDRLYEYKSQHGLPTWEQALESLLAARGVAKK